MRLDGYNGGIFTILRPVDLEIFAPGTFVLFSTKFLLYDDVMSSDEANSASCDLISAELSLLERSHWGDHNGGKIVFLCAIGHVLSVFYVFNINRFLLFFSVTGVTQSHYIIQFSNGFSCNFMLHKSSDVSQHQEESIELLCNFI